MRNDLIAHPDVGAPPETLFDKMVQWIQIKVGKELAGEVAGRVPSTYQPDPGGLLFGPYGARNTGLSS